MFVHQTSRDLGWPFDGVADQTWPDGGFALTIPANITYTQFQDLMLTVASSGFVDRQTNVLNIHMQFYSVQTYTGADMHLQAHFHNSGGMRTFAVCHDSAFFNGDATEVVFITLLSLWIGASLLWETVVVLNRKARARFVLTSSGKPVVCLITWEIILLLSTALGALIGLVLTAEVYTLWSYNYQDIFRPESPWPPPYMPEYGSILQSEQRLLSTFNFAVLTCSFRSFESYSVAARES